MKVFVWSYVHELTNSYHSGGGLVVFAKDLERAQELAKAEGVKFTVGDSVPDHVREVKGKEEMVFLMPDAGCC
jgi:3-hydroxyisobutyrate dehydrogenase-like beta-hydroxyacid dehydrogenase